MKNRLIVPCAPNARIAIGVKNGEAQPHQWAQKIDPRPALVLGSTNSISD